ncbi:MAG: response regulator [Candidatus Thiodiazotropha sp.]
MKLVSGENSRLLPDLADVGRRLALIFGVLILVLMLVVLLAGGLYLRGVMESEENRLATLTTQVLAHAVSRISFSGKYHARLMLEEIEQAQPSILYLQLVDPDGRIFAHSDPAHNDKMIDKEALARVRSVLKGEVSQMVRQVFVAGTPVREVSLAYRGGYNNAIIGTLQVGISDLEQQRALKRGLLYIALLVAALLALGIYLTLKISVYFGNPVRQVTIALERERALLRTLVSTIPDLVWMKDANGIYLTCNTAFERFFGAPEENIIGRTDYDFVSKELADFFRQKDKNAIAAGKPCVNEEWITFAEDGHRALLETTKTPMFATDGSLVGVLGFGHDITESRKIHQELTRHRDHLEEVVQIRTAELTEAMLAAEAANRAKSVFLANMSHELRTPLNAILGFSQLMELDTELPEDKRTNLGIINRSGHHLLSLINDVLEISKIEAGRQRVQTSIIDLPGMLNGLIDSISLRAHDNDTTLKTELATDLPNHIKSDAAKLWQILLNLLSNAVKFTKGGSVILAARIVERKEPDVIMEFEVRDTGIGIAATELKQIFSNFYQTEAGIQQGEGTGLGLAISYQYAKLLCGEITVESTQDRGSTFRLRLPVQTPVTEPAQSSPGRVIALCSGQPEYRILIAEDDPASRKLLQAWLKQLGFLVRSAANGKEAVELFQTWQPHFIWMDMRMPVMDGFAATRAIRALTEGKTLPIIAFTASAFDEDRQAILSAGCNEIMTKPLEEQRLFELLANYLGVKYEYSDAPEEELSPLSPADLGALPKDMQAQLLIAAENLDFNASSKLVEEMQLTFPAEAKYLQSLINFFRFDMIIESLTELSE